MEPDRGDHRAGIIAGNAQRGASPSDYVAITSRATPRYGLREPLLRAADHGKLDPTQQGRMADHERGLADAGDTEPTPIPGHGATQRSAIADRRVLRAGAEPA